MLRRGKVSLPVVPWSRNSQSVPLTSLCLPSTPCIQALLLSPWLLPAHPVEAENADSRDSVLTEGTHRPCSPYPGKEENLGLSSEAIS